VRTLEGRSAVVAYGWSGIGRAIALRLAQEALDGPPDFRKIPAGQDVEWKVG
jgi:hypothetical protein